MSSDAELLERWRNGDHGAGAALFERYYDRVERFFVNKVRGEIRDLVQDTFLALVKNQPKNPGKFREYLFSVAYKTLYNYLREKARRKARIDPDFSVSSAHDLSPGAATALGERREQRLLLEALRRVPMADQTLLELYYWEDLKIDEIAAILVIPSGTVKSRLSAARGRLEQVMRTIADSAEVLESTLSDLDAWARRCRAALEREADDDDNDGSDDGGGAPCGQ